eukprot:gene5526-5512_t
MVAGVTEDKWAQFRTFQATFAPLPHPFLSPPLHPSAVVGGTTKRVRCQGLLGNHCGYDVDTSLGASPDLSLLPCQPCGLSHLALQAEQLCPIAAAPCIAYPHPLPARLVPCARLSPLPSAQVFYAVDAALPRTTSDPGENMAMAATGMTPASTHPALSTYPRPPHQ